MRVVFTFPGLLAPTATAARAPALARLLSIADPPTTEPDGIAAALAPTYGISRQDDWPMASVRAAAHGLAPGTGWWLAADPVALVAGRDDVRLAQAIHDLDAAEAAALIDMLNAHFATDGIAFLAPKPDLWLVRAEFVSSVSTRPLETVIGRTLREAFPTGPDAPRWRRWQSEIQMLLHEHAVNSAREARGQVAVNSVWFWGGGRLPGPSPHLIRTFAQSGPALELAAWHGAAAQPLPRDFHALHADNASSSRPKSAVVPSLDSACVLAFGDTDDPAEQDPRFMAPAFAALARGAIESIVVIAGGAGAAVVWNIRRPGFVRRVTCRFADANPAPLLAAARAAGE